ncbi:MAG: tripartite tricarboxylate transporter substrate binding protein [Defluviitaleaceae bacterium]|nr:tripartite tricarboxylate transporter substrate binding protein [Defluviitaleaceae bacterium]
MKFNSKKAIALTAAIAAMTMFATACTPSAPATPAPAPAAPAAPAAPGPAPEAPAAETNYPSRDVGVIIPWAPGGVSDLNIRILSAEMADHWGIVMPITNMGGAGGSVGLAEAHAQTPDGYTILGTSVSALVNTQILGLVDVDFREWHAWLATFAPNIVAVRADSPFQTLDDLIEAMRANPGQITASSAGPGSSGHLGAIVFADGADVTFLHVPYEGGAPAIIAAMAGEVDFVAQLSSEKIEYIRSGDLRALASTADVDMTVTDIDGNEILIPSILNYAPGLSNITPFGGVFGIMVNENVPEPVLDQIEEAFHAAMATDSMANFMEDRASLSFNLGREASAEYIFQSAMIINWMMYDIGAAFVSPEDFGIPRQ